jgi:hypothetical protein
MMILESCFACTIQVAEFRLGHPAPSAANRQDLDQQHRTLPAMGRTDHPQLNQGSLGYPKCHIDQKNPVPMQDVM